MKKNLFVIVLALLMAVALMACSAEEAVETAQEPKEESAQVEEVVEEAEEEIEEAEEDKEEALEDSTEGADLLSQLSGQMPKSLKMKMTTESFGMVTSSISYYEGDNTRTEIMIEGLGTSVIIYNADEEIIYSYVEGEELATRIMGADIDSAEEIGLTVDITNKYTELTEEIPDNMIARKEELDGEEVVYIEVTEVDDEMGEMLIKMWYSTKYNTPLKYEVLVDGQSFMLLTVTELETDMDIDSSIFMPPMGMEFIDVDLDSMLEMTELGD